MTKTPEGYLIAHDVPIARTGWQEYLRRELGLTDDPEGRAMVYRAPEEVFHPAAMASFEGKSVTDEHPSESVGPHNYAAYERGIVTNVRRGSDDESDLLLADLIIKDPRLISDIEHDNKREVSCGYDCQYEPLEDGRYAQKNIRGNHVAVVSAGRAGDRVAIKDEKPVEAAGRPPERRKPVKIDRTTLIGKILATFAKDAEPEEVAEASKLLHSEADRRSRDAEEERRREEEDRKTRDEERRREEDARKAKDEERRREEEDRKAKDRGTKDADGEPTLADVLKAITELAARIKGQEEPEDEFDALEKALEKGDETGEESRTIEPEKIGDEANLEPDKRPITPPGADSKAAVLAGIRAVKPIIAMLPESQRKAAKDAALKAFKEQLGTPPDGQNAYAGILRAVQNNTRTQDSKLTPEEEDPREIGRRWAREFNPRKRKEGAR